MNKIIPYDENLNKSNGAIISVDGDIHYIQNSHEIYAKNYCNGKDYNKLRYIKNCSSDLLFDEFQDSYSFHGERKDINEWSGSQLTSKQLELYKKWLKKYSRYYKDSSSLDFMILFLEFDKVESMKKHMITTSSKIPHIRFYNYYLMDWEIVQLPKVIYHEDSSTFEFLDNRLIDLYHSSSNDSEALEEIQEIKKKVKKSNIPYFFK